MAEFDIQSALERMEGKMDTFIQTQATHNEQSSERHAKAETRLDGIDDDLKNARIWDYVKYAGTALASVGSSIGLKHIFKGL
jgi:hypothetical protein